MDLTKRFPRGPRERLAGIAMLARTIDKARAELAGTIGEYYFNCPMDRQLFGALGVGAAQFLEAVRSSRADSEIIARLQENGELPAGPDLEAHNSAIDFWAPKSDEGRARFVEQREKLAPGSEDVTTWTELIDFEEGRTALKAR